MAEPTRRQQNTIDFLRLAAAQMRQLAQRSPEIALELYHVSRQLEAEADELVRSDSE